MAGLIEQNAKTKIKYWHKAGVSDGKLSYTDYPCLAIVLDYTQADIDYFGTVKNGKVFLVAPFEMTPELPCRVTHDGKEYDVKGIKTYRSLNGTLLGYRLAVQGG